MTPYVKVDCYKSEPTTASITITDRDAVFNVAEYDKIGVSFYEILGGKEGSSSITCIEVIFYKNLKEIQYGCVELHTCSLFDVTEFDEILIRFRNTNNLDTGSIQTDEDFDSSGDNSDNDSVGDGFYN